MHLFILNTRPITYRPWASSRLPFYYCNRSLYVKSSPRCDSSSSSSPPPPRVKSSFYKRPSKAIEKGGGFYFPGLRGPRLRIAVGVVVLGLLLTNALAAVTSGVGEGSLWTSQALGLIGAIALWASAGVELLEERRNKNGKKLKGSSEESMTQALGSGRPAPTVKGEHYPLETEAEDEMEWAAAIVMDLTPADTVMVFWGSRAVYRVGKFVDDVGLGEVVERVAKENRALYVADTATLPEDVRIPFLGPSRMHSVYLQPLLGGEAVFVAAAVRDRRSVEPTFDSRDRVWISQVVRKIELALRKSMESSVWESMST